MNIFGHSLRFPETQGMVARRENSVNEGLSVGRLRVRPPLAPMGGGRLKQCRPYGFAYQCSACALAWIEILAQAVADEVECQHSQGDSNSRKDQRVRRSLQG